MAHTTAESHTRKTRRRRPRISKVTNAATALADFDRGLETYVLTFGQFSMMDAIMAILDKTGPADVALATWTAASADLRRSAELLHDKRFRSLRFIVDCSFPQRQPGYAQQLLQLFGPDAIRTTRTHAKFAVITNNDWNVVVRTSMNLNENPRLESLEVTDDEDFATWMLELVDTIFEEETPDFVTKSRPELTGMPDILPASQVSMGHGVQMGT